MGLQYKDVPQRLAVQACSAVKRDGTHVRKWLPQLRCYWAWHPEVSRICSISLSTVADFKLGDAFARLRGSTSCCAFRRRFTPPCWGRVG